MLEFRVSNHRGGVRRERIEGTPPPSLVPSPPTPRLIKAQCFVEQPTSEDGVQAYTCTNALFAPQENVLLEVLLRYVQMVSTILEAIVHLPQISCSSNRNRSTYGTRDILGQESSNPDSACRVGDIPCGYLEYSAGNISINIMII